VSAAGASLSGALLNLTSIAASVAVFTSATASPAYAMYNKDLNIPITDPVGAMATVLATKDAVKDILVGGSRAHSTISTGAG